MPATEIFQKILTAVSAETEIEPQVILSEKRESDVVDARYILIHRLDRCGLSSPHIARLMGKNPRFVNYVKSNYDQRLKQSRYMRHCAAAIGQKMGDNEVVNWR